jgi:hypothetical protein
MTAPTKSIAPLVIDEPQSPLDAFVDRQKREMRAAIEAFAKKQNNRITQRAELLFKDALGRIAVGGPFVTAAGRCVGFCLPEPPVFDSNLMIDARTPKKRQAALKAIAAINAELQPILDRVCIDTQYRICLEQDWSLREDGTTVTSYLAYVIQQVKPGESLPPRQPRSTKKRAPSRKQVGGSRKKRPAVTKKRHGELDDTESDNCVSIEDDVDDDDDDDDDDAADDAADNDSVPQTAEPASAIRIVVPPKRYDPSPLISTAEEAKNNSVLRAATQRVQTPLRPIAQITLPGHGASDTAGASVQEIE